MRFLTRVPSCLPPRAFSPFHYTLETLDHWTKPHEALSEDPLTNPEEIWYIDGSRFVLDGKRRAGYAVVSNFETIEAKPLPPAVKVPGHDSWIHYSQVKPWKKTEKDIQYTCEPWEISDTYSELPVNQLQHAVPVQQRYKTTADHGKYHTPLDTAIRTLRIETSKRGRPNTPRRPS